MFTNDLDIIIKDYLTAKDTDYAIMIRGGWGSGKTYYVSHGLRDLVNGTLAPKDSSTDAEKDFDKEKHYSIAYISLYGLSSPEDFDARVFSGINSWINRRIWRVSGLLVSKAANAFGISFGKKDTKPITIVRKNRVLVFDDLERICEEKMPVKEVLGLINSYAEHTHHKVIIVCNEAEYTSDDTAERVKESYKKYKEKSVRFTYELNPDEKTAYDVMVSSISDVDYKAYLKNEKASVLSLFKLGGRRNMRTLKFIVDSFGKIYGLIQGAKYKDRIHRIYLVTFVLYSCEYKQGRSADELRSLDIRKYKIDTSASLDIHRGDVENGEEDYEKVFRERYDRVYRDFRPCDVIINYIESGYLDKEEFAKDAQKLDSELERLTLKPEGVVYQKLLRMTELNDNEVMPLIDELISYVKEDKYDLYDLLSIYVLLVKYDYWRIDSFELSDDLDDVFKEAMERQRVHHKYNEMFDVRTPIFDDRERGKRPYMKYNAMKDIASDINKWAKKEADSVVGNTFMTAAETGDMEKLRTFRANEEYRIPVSGLDWKRVVDSIIGSPNPVACEICECLISIMPGTGSLSFEETDRANNELIPLLDNYLQSDACQIRRVYVQELRNHLKDVLR